MITSEELNELELQCERVIAMQDGFTEALKAVAEKHDMDASGLRQFVTAKVRDKLEALEKRQDTLAQLKLFEDGGLVDQLRDGSVRIEMPEAAE